MTISARLFLALSFTPLLCAQAPKYQTDALSMNPLGFWQLNGNFTDQSGNGHNGTPTNGVPFLSPGAPLGVPGNSCCQAGLFDGGFVTIPGATFAFGPLKAMTAMAWARTINQHNFDLIVGKFDPGSSTGWAFGVDNGDLGATPGSGHLAFVLVTNGTPILVVESAVSVNDGVVRLYAVSYDGSGSAAGVKLYIDGLSVGTMPAVDNIHSQSISNTQPLTIGAGTDGSSSFEGDIAGVAIFNTALTAAQHLQLGLDNSGFAARGLAQFAFGGGWYSAIFFNNTGINPVSFPVNFIEDKGGPLNVPAINGSSTTVTLPPGATTVIEALNSGSLQQGFVMMSLPLGVVAFGVFRQTAPPAPDQEAVVPLTSTTGQLYTLIYDETNSTTAVSIANPSSITVNVSVDVIDSTGNVIGSSPLTLPPLNKKAVVVRTLPGLAGMAGTRGSIVISVASGSVAALGLRFAGVALTSIPAAARAGF